MLAVLGRPEEYSSIHSWGTVVPRGLAIEGMDFNSLFLSALSPYPLSLPLSPAQRVRPRSLGCSNAVDPIRPSLVVHLLRRDLDSLRRARR